MDIIVVNREKGTTRQFSVGTRSLVGGTVAALALFAVCATFILQSTHVAPNRVEQGIPQALRTQLLSGLEEQKEQVETARQQLSDNTHALARRVALLQAQMMRIDAAAKRVVEHAGLSSAEFGFNAQPAVGGPAASQVDDISLTMDRQMAILDALDEDLSSRENQIAVIEDLLVAAQIQREIKPSGYPGENGWVSSLFGMRTDPFTGRRARHSGIDYAGRDGSNIVAVASGVITFAGRRSGYGKIVEINHGNGYVTRYAHNKENLASVGDRVTKGQPVAIMGSTGRSTGPHVHFEVLFNGKAVDPIRYIQSAG